MHVQVICLEIWPNRSPALTLRNLRAASRNPGPGPLRHARHLEKAGQQQPASGRTQSSGRLDPQLGHSDQHAGAARGEGLTAFRADQSILSPEFLAAAFRSTKFQAQLFKNMGQTTRNQVPITAQRELRVALPPSLPSNKPSPPASRPSKPSRPASAPPWPNSTPCSPRCNSGPLQGSCRFCFCHESSNRFVAIELAFVRSTIFISDK